jgi:hypothetical protein
VVRFSLAEPFAEAGDRHGKNTGWLTLTRLLQEDIQLNWSNQAAWAAAA